MEIIEAHCSATFFLINVGRKRVYHQAHSLLAERKVGELRLKVVILEFWKQIAKWK